MSWPLPADLDDVALYQRLFPPPERPDPETVIPVPDWKHIGTQLAGRGVTRRLVWLEYRAEHPDSYGYSQFCELYRRWSGHRKATMRQDHKGGQAYVDYAGMTASVVDLETGEVREVQVFVLTLGASKYLYAEGSASAAAPTPTTWPRSSCGGWSSGRDPDSSRRRNMVGASVTNVAPSWRPPPCYGTPRRGRLAQPPTSLRGAWPCPRAPANRRVPPAPSIDGGRVPEDPELPEGGVTIVGAEDFSRGEAKRRWVELIRLVYDVDPMVCPKCGGEMQAIALIQAPAVIDKILRHLRDKGRDARAGPWATGPPGAGATDEAA